MNQTQMTQYRGIGSRTNEEQHNFRNQDSPTPTNIWNDTLHPDSSIAKAESDIAKFAENSESWNPCSSI